MTIETSFRRRPNLIAVNSGNERTQNSKSAIFNIDWNDYKIQSFDNDENIRLDLSLENQGYVEALLDKICTIYIDNSNCSFGVTIFFPDTGYTLYIDRGEIFYGAAYTNITNFRIITDKYLLSLNPRTRVVLFNMGGNSYRIPNTTQKIISRYRGNFVKSVSPAATTTTTFISTSDIDENSAMVIFMDTLFTENPMRGNQITIDGEVYTPRFLSSLGLRINTAAYLLKDFPRQASLNIQIDNIGTDAVSFEYINLAIYEMNNISRAGINLHTSASDIINRNHYTNTIDVDKDTAIFASGIFFNQNLLELYIDGVENRYFRASTAPNSEIHTGAYFIGGNIIADKNTTVKVGNLSQNINSMSYFTLLSWS